MLMSHLLDPVMLKALYFQRDSRGNQLRPKTLFLQGKPGIGKTSVIREFPRMLSELFGEEFGYWQYVTPEYEAQDLRGFTIPTKNAKGKPITVFARSPVMPDEDYFEKHPRGILLVDEANQGDMPMNKAQSALFLEGRMGDVTLPIGWWVIAASNALAHRSGVIRMPMHNVNRIRIVDIDADKASLQAYFERTDMHPMGLAFFEQFPGVVIASEMPVDPVPYCTPRSFESSMTLIREYAGRNDEGHVIMDIPNNSTIMEACAGDVGQGVMRQMFAYFKNAEHLPTFASILKDPTRAKVPGIETLSAAYAAMIMCVQNTTAQNVDTVWQYIERLPLPLQTSSAKQLLDKTKGALLNSKRLGQWISRNQALIQATLRT
jgi:hypothetical protein